MRRRLWPYLGGIAKQNQIKALAVGGPRITSTFLCPCQTTSSIAKAIQLLKGNSSKWINETFPKMRSFARQGGYGAFSIAISGVEATIAYIRNQAEHHHRARSFHEEFVGMLRTHGFDHDESMLD